MIRFIIVAATVVLYLILGIPVLLIEWVIGKFNREAKDYSCLRLVQGAFKFIMWETGVKLTVIGEENVPKDRAALFVGNHKSYFDIVMTYARMPRLTGYIAKKEMEKVPLLNRWMKALYCLFLDRSDIKQGLQIIMTGIEYVNKGISIFIFPEGTRIRGEEMEPFKEGSLKIAQRTGCPVVPVAITNAAEIFENHTPKIRPCHVILQYGEPIDPTTLSKEDKKFLGAYTQRKIQAMLDEHKAIL